MISYKPLIGIACLCEQVLREVDGVSSAIRIVDVFTVPLPAEGVLRPPIRFTAFILLKSGAYRGSGNVSLTLRNPNDVSVPVHGPTPLLFEGAEHGNSLIITMNMPIEIMGVFHLDVHWNEEMLTAIPFKLQPARE